MEEKEKKEKKEKQEEEEEEGFHWPVGIILGFSLINSLKACRHIFTNLLKVLKYLKPKQICRS